MIRLNSAHIESIRKYFLSQDEATRAAVLTSIQPSELANFLLKLKDFFTGSQHSSLQLEDFDKDIDISAEAGALLKIQEDYYTAFAALYQSGIMNSDILAMIEVNNQKFIEEINFQKELNTAFRLTEREALKIKFGVLEKESKDDIEEIATAFHLKERDQLKKRFQQLEAEVAPAVNRPAPVIRFNWKKMAVAASIAVFILAATFIVLNSKKGEQFHPGTASVDAKNATDSIANYKHTQRYLSELLTKNFDPSGKVEKVLKEPSYGFGTIDEKILIAVYDLQPAIQEINAQVAKMPAGKGFDRELDLLKMRSDSLNGLLQQYMFNHDTLTLYRAFGTDIKMYKIGAAYYFKSGRIIYECKKSPLPSPLKTLNSKTITDRIEMLN